MKDFFYYSMIRSKDEDTTKTRKLNGTVPLNELPNLMRAMGYYPTNQEVNNMKDEVKFSVYSDLGDPTNTVDMDTFIRLFVNHRPVYGIGKNNIEDAFKALASDQGSIQLTRGKFLYIKSILISLFLNRWTDRYFQTRWRGLWWWGAWWSIRIFGWKESLYSGSSKRLYHCRRVRIWSSWIWRIWRRRWGNWGCWGSCFR